MYTIIKTDKINVYEGTYREWIVSGKRGEMLMQCKSKLEAKVRAREFANQYKTLIDAPFAVHMTRLEMYRLGQIDKPFTAESLRKMSEKKLGNKNPNFGGLKEETKRKMSAVRKGKSGFQGKKHRPESKAKTSLSMRGKKNVLGWFWVNNGLDEEKRAKSVPQGWFRGRVPGLVRSIFSRYRKR